jgi:hypothetical protein
LYCCRDGGYDDSVADSGVIESNWDEVVEKFDDMDLREDLLRGIYAYGWGLYQPLLVMFDFIV